MRRIRKAMKKIFWSWDPGIRSSYRSPRFELTEREALQVDALVDNLWKWADREGFDKDAVIREISEMETEIALLKGKLQKYQDAVDEIERKTGAEFPGLFPNGPSLGGEDQDGNYYQVVDGVIEN